MDYSTLLVWVSGMWVFFQALQMVINKSSTAKLPPGPPQLPLIGSLHKIGNNPHESLAELAKTYGPLMTLKLGKITTIVVSSATMAKEVLQKHDHVLAGRTVRDSVRPVVPLLPHRAESKVEIGDFTIPKNSQVLVNVWAIGRDPDTWVNPTSFMPERFLGSNKDYKGWDFELIPFGAGRRICPGLPLAFRMVNLMLASLLHSFGCELPDAIAPEDVDMSQKFGVSLRKEVPLRAIPVIHQ